MTATFDPAISSQQDAATLEELCEWDTDDADANVP